MYGKCGTEDNVSITAAVEYSIVIRKQLLPKHVYCNNAGFIVNLRCGKMYPDILIFIKYN